MRKNKQLRNSEPYYKSKIISMLFFVIALFLIINNSIAQPSGPAITNLSTEQATPQGATTLTTSGGTISTILLNATTQNPRWKAYVGNITGKLALRDASNYTIFDWQLSSMEGEVFATVNNSINWSGIRCANLTDIASEELRMNHTATRVDSIRNTFNRTTHRDFYVHTTHFYANSCNFTARTYVNNTFQDTNFQEILLSDGQSMVYSTLINDSALGFDLNYYDFQMIVAENAIATSTATTYYFYVELV